MHAQQGFLQPNAPILRHVNRRVEEWGHEWPIVDLNAVRVPSAAFLHNGLPFRPESRMKVGAAADTEALAAAEVRVEPYRCANNSGDAAYVGCGEDATISLGEEWHARTMKLEGAGSLTTVCEAMSRCTGDH